MSSLFGEAFQTRATGHRKYARRRAARLFVTDVKLCGHLSSPCVEFSFTLFLCCSSLR